MVAKYFLDPQKKLIDAVVEELSKEIQTLPSGAKSLAHLLVVVPTAQAGRQLRLALGRQFEGGGMIPPMIKMPVHLLEPADSKEFRAASDAEYYVAFFDFIDNGVDTEVSEAFKGVFEKFLKGDTDWVIGIARQLDEIWQILGEKGLLIQDVAQNDEAKALWQKKELGNIEEKRWKKLADIEKAFFAFLNKPQADGGKYGLRHHAQALREAKINPKLLPSEIKKAILPSLVDPLPIFFDTLTKIQEKSSIEICIWLHADKDMVDYFDKNGCPVIENWTGDHRPDLSEKMRTGDIFKATTIPEMSAIAAKDFPDVKANADMPSLGMISADIYPQLAAAFEKRGFELHNPETHNLAISSLGRIIIHLMTLHARKDLPWKAVVALFRENDVQKMMNNLSSYQLLKEIDDFQNARFPLTISFDFDVEEYDDHEKKRVEKYSTLKKAIDILRSKMEEANTNSGNEVIWLAKMLGLIYKNHHGTDIKEEKEFSSAVDATVKMLLTIPYSSFGALNLDARKEIISGLLTKAQYQLEPPDTDVITTEGWLELAWSPAEKVALVGFQEGAVPESVVGHPFLPDSLREKLELECNAKRLARDSFLFTELLTCRKPGDVRAYFCQIDARGNLLRPSKLLFFCNDEKLPGRAAKLFQDPVVTCQMPPRNIEKMWQFIFRNDYKPVESLSASKIDTYLNSPYVFFLKYVVGLKTNEVKEELGNDDFGTLIHSIMAEYGQQNDQGKIAANSKNTAEEINDAVQKILNKRKEVFGNNIGADIRIQLAAAKKRLEYFAKVEAEYMKKDGWKILATELAFSGLNIFDIEFSGSIDRIDYRFRDGHYEFCLTDYKTWPQENSDKCFAKRLVASNRSQKMKKLYDKLQIEGFVCGYSAKQEKKYEYLQTLQMPIYTLALKKLAEECNGDLWDKIKQEVGESSGQAMLNDMKDKSNIVSQYFVLGETEKNTFLVGRRDENEGADANEKTLEQYQDYSEGLLQCLISRIKEQIYAPVMAGNDHSWEYAFKHLFLNKPEDNCADEWLEKQNEKLTEWLKKFMEE